MRGAIADPRRTKAVRRLLYRDGDDEPTLSDVPRDWVALDFDSLPRPDWVEPNDLLACGVVAIEALPKEFRNASCVVQATSGHGLKPGIRLRLWYWLSRPTSSAELKCWLRTAPVDRVIFGAAQVIYTATIVAGRPNKMTPLPSYEGWSAMVREPLVWLGCADPVETMQELRNEDLKAAERHAIFNSRKMTIGIGKDRSATTKEVIEAATMAPELKEALLVVAMQRHGSEIDPKALGKWLSRELNSIAAGCKLLVDRANAARPKWHLEFQNRSS